MALRDELARAMKFGRYGTRAEAMARAEGELDQILGNRQKWIDAFGEKDGAEAWRSAVETAANHVQRLKLEEGLDPLGDVQRQISEAPGVRLKGEALVPGEAFQPHRTVLGHRAVNAARRMQMAEDGLQSFREIAARRYGPDWADKLDHAGRMELYRRELLHQKAAQEYRAAFQAEGLIPSMQEAVSGAQDEVRKAAEEVGKTIESMNALSARRNFEDATDALRGFVEVVRRTKGTFDYKALAPTMREDYDRLVQLYEDARANFNRAASRGPGFKPPQVEPPPPQGPELGFASGKRPSWGEDWRRAREDQYGRALNQRRAIEREMSELTDYYTYLHENAQDAIAHRVSKGFSEEVARKQHELELQQVAVTMRRLERRLQELQRREVERGGLGGGEGLGAVARVAERAVRYAPGGAEPQATQTPGSAPQGVERPQPESEKDMLRKAMLLGGIADVNPFAAIGWALLSDPEISKTVGAEAESMIPKKPTVRGKPVHPTLPGPEEQLRRLEEKRGLRRQ